VTIPARDQYRWRNVALLVVDEVDVVVMVDGSGLRQTVNTWL
jgi:hypothetical protein